MALPKKNQLFQFEVPMVLSTDFASVKSNLTASQFNAGTRKFFGLNHGSSAAITSGAISKVGSLVRSGVFRVTVKPAECNYDRVRFAFDGVTSCAFQMIVENFMDSDDSDLASNITAVASQLLLVKSMVSDAMSAAQQGNSRVAVANSRVLVNKSVISDIYSMLSDFQSDFQSRVPKLVATNSQLSDIISDLISKAATATQLASRVWSNATGAAVASQVLVIKSQASDLASKLSDVESNLLSFLATTGVQLNTSVMSDIRSAISAGATGALTVSDISDIASAVKVALASLITTTGVNLNTSVMSDIRSAITAAPTVTVSDISDIASAVKVALASLITTTGVNLNTSVMSDIRSAVNAVTVNLTASDISDIASAVVAAVTVTLTQVNSRVLLVQSYVSDLQSKLSDVESNLLSFLGTTGVQLNTSVMSDLRSAISAGGTGALTVSDISDIASAVRATMASDLSDILSSTQQVNSRVLVSKSMVSDIYSLLSHVDSNLQSRIPKAVATNSQLSALVSDLQSSLSDMQSDFNSQLSSIQSDLDNVQTRIPTLANAILLNLSAGTMKAGTVDTAGFSPTTTEFESDDIITATTGHWNGRSIIFTSGTLQNQATSISNYSLIGGRGHFTVVALTSAPADNVTFIIV